MVFGGEGRMKPLSLVELVLLRRAEEQCAAVGRVVPEEVHAERKRIGRLGGRPKGALNRIHANDVIGFMSGKEKVTASDVAERFDVVLNAAQAILSRLHRAGRIRKPAYGVYVLADFPRATDEEREAARAKLEARGIAV